MDIERAIIVSGLAAAVLAWFVVPVAFWWGVRLGARGRLKRRAPKRREPPRATGYQYWR